MVTIPCRNHLTTSRKRASTTRYHRMKVFMPPDPISPERHQIPIRFGRYLPHSSPSNDSGIRTPCFPILHPKQRQKHGLLILTYTCFPKRCPKRNRNYFTRPIQILNITPQESWILIENMNVFWYIPWLPRLPRRMLYHMVWRQNSVIARWISWQQRYPAQGTTVKFKLPRNNDTTP